MLRMCDMWPCTWNLGRGSWVHQSSEPIHWKPWKAHGFQSPGGALAKSNKHGQVRSYLLIAPCFWLGRLVGTRDLRTLWGAPAGPVHAAQAGLACPSCPVHPRLARLAPNCITHPHWMYKRPWHFARPPTAAALAEIRECHWRTHRQTDTKFALIYRIGPKWVAISEYLVCQSTCNPSFSFMGEVGKKVSN
jgi:hypothetical protein